MSQPSEAIYAVVDFIKSLPARIARAKKAVVPVVASVVAAAAVVLDLVPENDNLKAVFAAVLALLTAIGVYKAKNAPAV